MRYVVIAALAACLAGCSALGTRGDASLGQAQGSGHPVADAAGAAGGCGPSGPLDLKDGPRTLARGVSSSERISETPQIDLGEAQRQGFAGPIGGAMDGLPLRGVFQLDTTYVVMYFTAAKFNRDDTRAEFLSDGGYILKQTKPGRPNIAAIVADEVGDRSSPVDIGSHAGALNHFDPIAPDVRPFGIWWYDDSTNSEWSLVAGSSDARAAVGFARAVACT